ncbi:MAG: outer membrane beta-barrel protein [Bacteroidota bacterium]|jgi:hemolysin activation/secretion protein
MRSLFVVCIVTLFLSNAFAQEQIKQHVYTLGGSVYYASSTEKSDAYESDGSTYLFMPGVSYFIVDQCELSLSIGYIHSVSNNSSSLYNLSSSESKTTSLDLGLGIRYYFPAGNIAPFIGASGGTGWTSFQSQSFSTPQTNFRVTGGLEIFISQSAAIEPTINYDSYHYNDQTSSHGIQIGLGVKYFIL